jgi:hypothetical protein
VSLEGRVKNLERCQSEIDAEDTSNVWTWEAQVAWYETAYSYEKWLYLWDLVELGKAQGTPVSDPDRLLESGLQLLLHYLECGVVVEYEKYRSLIPPYESTYGIRESVIDWSTPGSVMDDPDVLAHKSRGYPSMFLGYIFEYMEEKGFEYTALGDVRAWLEERLHSDQECDTKTTKSG